jgi:hypothetical protein
MIAMLAAAGAMLAACAPANNDAASQVEPVAEAAAEPAAPLYISRKHVSTDCGVAATPSPIPGFADRPNEEVLEMPPPLANMMAIGADRPMVETDHERVSPGYVLIEPIFVGPSMLINNDKEIVATFENDYFSSFTLLQDDGSRLVNAFIWNEVFQDGGGNRGCLEEYAVDGSLNWRLMLSTPDYIQHHDMVKLPNGNILTIVWERVSAAHAIELGRDPENVAENGDLWYDGIIEINPETAEIVWEWSMRHHMIQDFDPAKANYGVVADHPGRLDINAINFNMDGSVDPDWTHVNALDYNPELDQIIFSSNYLSEVYVIDHGTTPYESQGPAGDFLYRWGNPQNYDRGSEDDQKLFHQHDVHWIKSGLSGAGNLMIFNNGSGQRRPYSTVVEFSPQMNADGTYVLNEGEAYGPEELVWEYDPPDEEKFLSFFISGAQRLPNGNTLVNQGAGAKVREVTADGEIVWEYGYSDETDGAHALFRAYRFPEDHPAITAILEQSNNQD